MGTMSEKFRNDELGSYKTAHKRFKTILIKGIEKLGMGCNNVTLGAEPFFKIKVDESRVDRSMVYQHLLF